MDTTAVAGEIQDVNDAIDLLIKACQARGLDTYDVITKLAWDIDDMAMGYETDSVGSFSSLADDPFYWSTY